MWASTFKVNTSYIWKHTNTCNIQPWYDETYYRCSTASLHVHMQPQCCAHQLQLWCHHILSCVTSVYMPILVQMYTTTHTNVSKAEANVPYQIQNNALCLLTKYMLIHTNNCICQIHTKTSLVRHTDFLVFWVEDVYWYVLWYVVCVSVSSIYLTWIGRHNEL